jgi:hypothetical protein
MASPHTANPPSLQIDWMLTFWWVLVFATAVLATLVSLYALLYYLDKGWAWRAETISNSLRADAKDSYLRLYHRQASNAESVATADRRFEEFYRRWYGRARLGFPIGIIGVITFAYAFLAALVAADFLRGSTLLAIHTNAVVLSAIAGGYTVVTYDGIVRVVQRDLTPEDLYMNAFRLAVCVPIGYTFALLAPAVSGMPFVAFAVAAFPIQQIIDLMRKMASQRLGITPTDAAEAQDVLLALSGVDQKISERIRLIGVTTITQLAYSDPVQLTMRTNLGFNLVLDLVSQSLARIYLDSKMDLIRPAGLRGAVELRTLELEAEGQAPSPTSDVLGLGSTGNARAVIDQIPTVLGLTKEQFLNALHEIADDPYADFLMRAWG